MALPALLQQPKVGTHASGPIVWAIGFFAFLNVYSMQAVLPMVKAEFLTNSTIAGLLVGITLLAMAFVSPFIGMVSDHMGRKNIVCTAILALAAMTAAIPICSNIYLLMFMRFCQGLAAPGIIVATIAYMADEIPLRILPRFTTAYIGGTIMGGFSGRFITGYVSHWLGWRNGFFFLAGLTAIGAFLVWKRLPPSKRFIASADMHSELHVLVQHLKNSRLLATCAAGFCVLYSLVAVFTYITLRLDQPPFSMSATGLANLFCIYLVGVFITPMTSKIIRRLGSRTAMLCALFFSMAGLLLTLSSSVFLIIIGLTIGSCGIFICQSISIGVLASSVNEGRSLATGLYYLAYYCGGAMGAVLAGLAYDAYQWPGAIATIIVFQLTAACIAAYSWKDLKR